MRAHPLRPRSIDDFKNNAYVQHDLRTPNIATINSADEPRRIQFGLKYNF